ncbi:MAG: 2-C-methyl-D-erythritol 4-phosphate cytidylyltransferase [archaeon]
MSNFVVIVAGGKGKRMKADKNKCFLDLMGKEVLAWTTEVFEKLNFIDGIVFSMGSEEEEREVMSLAKKHGFKKILKAVTGVPTRQAGVYAGIKALEEFKVKDEDVVLVHNGANPFIQEGEIEQLIKALDDFDGSVCAFPVKDTTRQVDENKVSLGVIDRSKLWLMQTPQCVRFGMAVKAFRKARADGFTGTDDVQLVERIGGKVKIVECSYENIKITTPEDLMLAEKILEKRLAFHDV